MRALDITGQRFGRLTAIRRDGSINHDARWLFICDCGSEKALSIAKVRSGNTQSCGCFATESKRTAKKHGECLGLHQITKPRLYRIWLNMKTRCGNPKNPSYAHYGAKGVTVCEEWRADFGAFRTWALANGYQDNLSIDRRSNSAGYSPDNCRWATPLEQAANRGGKFAKAA